MRIAIVNDNSGNRLILRRIIEKHTDHFICWEADNGEVAITRCKADIPDLILMDMIMPGINGVEATRIIMQKSACAILIVTASITGNASMVFEAMSAGALDVVTTPLLGSHTEDSDITQLLKKINMVTQLINTTARLEISATNKQKNNTDQAIVIFGASTGGPGVLAKILSSLPSDFPAPIVIVQHVDEYFSTSFAKWLNEQSQLEVRTANEGDTLIPGEVLVARTGKHLMMVRNGQLTYSVTPEEYVYKPSVNVFFNSVAKYWDGQIIACLFTGMGRDGAGGLLRIREKGGYTITQDEKSCAVYGMPKAADEIDASIRSMKPGDIAEFIIDMLTNKKKILSGQA